MSKLSRRFCNGFTLISRSETAFTLIELMVAITILAVLSVIAMVTFTSIQQSSRDARRRQEILQIANAIESHKDPTSGSYSYTTDQLAGDFRSNSQAATGLDPSGNNYCIVTYSSLPSSAIAIPTVVTSTPTTCSITTSDTATPSTLAASITGTGLLSAGTAKAWMICTHMEASTQPFCKGSSAGQ